MYTILVKVAQVNTFVDNCFSSFPDPFNNFVAVWRNLTMQLNLKMIGIYKYEYCTRLLAF